MESKSTDWRPGNTVCRCCLTEGCYKDISTEYFWMGKREVYSEMLTETFDLNIAFSKSGGPNSNSRLICEPCISRLRDASDFKRQVQECERTFMQFLDPGSSGVMTEVELDKEVKIEAVKLEEASDEDLFDDRDFGTMDDDDDDDLDDQPLTKLASKIPKKESVDIMELLDSAKVGDKRKASTKLKVSPTKKVSSRIIKITGKEVKVKNKKLLVKATTSSKEPKATVSKLTVKPEKKKKDCNRVTFSRRNAENLIRYTTAYPFKLPDGCIVCVYCGESYVDPSIFRKHMADEHTTFKTHMAYAHVHEGYVKVDCTDLRCRICSEPFETLEDASKHLREEHAQLFDLDRDLGLQMFKFHDRKLSCAICSKLFADLRSLSRHTQFHYAKYTCESCGKSYSTTSSLHQHLKNSHSTENKCHRCKKSFTSIAELKEHSSVSKRCFKYLCTVCGERFSTYVLRSRHIRESHDPIIKTFSCQECGLQFNSSKKMRSHYIMRHTDNFVCSCCGLKFVNKRRLEEHKTVHTKEKLFSCTVCAKSFPHKKNLTQHMWIHSEVKRFECTLCKKEFNQRISWKTHMNSYHPELLELRFGEKDNVKLQISLDNKSRVETDS